MEKTDDSDILKRNIGRIHTTGLGTVRIKRNLSLDIGDVADWCRQRIEHADEIVKEGKNWYVRADDAVITVNAHSYTVITAHKTNDFL